MLTQILSPWDISTAISPMAGISKVMGFDNVATMYWVSK